MSLLYQIAEKKRNNVFQLFMLKNVIVITQQLYKVITYKDNQKTVE